VVTEAMFILRRVAGWPAQNGLWRLLERGQLEMIELSVTDQKRMRELMEKYRDVPMDLADASLVVAAEARSMRRIFTLDSDFTIYRVGSRTPLELLPEP
jgi:predicted nucleic acid-binding protein